MEQGDFNTVVARVPVTLSEPVTRPVIVAYESAPPGTDPVAGTLVFAPGETAKTVPIQIQGNPDQEEDVLVPLAFSDPINASLDGDEGGVWIVAEPSAMIDAPVADLRWAVGDEVAFSGLVDDPVDGELPPSALSWQLLWHDCRNEPNNCTMQVLEEWDGVAGGSFVTPDLPYPSHVELVLMADGPSGPTYRVARELLPATVDLTFATDRPGLDLSTFRPGDTLSVRQPAPFVRTVIQESTALFVIAPSPQTVDGVTYVFDEWSHSAAQGHSIPAASAPATYTAFYRVEESGAAPG